MKTRKILAGAAAVTIGSLAALAFATPASAADSRVKPTATFESTCANNTVTATVSTTGDAAVKFKILLNDANKTVKVPVTEITSKTSPKTFTITDASEDLVLLWNEHNRPDPQVEAQPPAGKWALPDRCKPSHATVNATCDNPVMKVTVTNPDVAGVEQIRVAVVDANGVAANIKRGESKAFLAAADLKLKVSGGLITTPVFWTIGYVAPTGCDAAAPQPTITQVVLVDGNAGGNAGNAGGAGTGAKGGSDDSLPVTGSPVRTVVVAGFALLLIGLVAFAVSRRRSRVRFTSAG